MQDYEWLRAYAHERSDDAFGQIVEQYGAMVYSCCFRQLRDAHLAEDATQATFLVLSKKADKLREDIVLGSWLMKTANFVCKNANKVRANRNKHEGKAADGKVLETSFESESSDWEAVSPKLDSALTSLPEKSRRAVVLHFFMGKTQKEVGKEIGCSENAVTQRIAYALKTLRSKLSRFGIILSPEVLSEYLTTNTLEPIPAGLTSGINKAVLGQGVTSGATATLAKGAMDMMFYAKVKMVAVVLGGVVLLGGAGQQIASGWVGDDVKKVPLMEKKAEQPFGPTSNGLELGLSADKLVTRMKGDGSGVKPIPLKMTFRNSGPNKLKINVWTHTFHREIINVVVTDKDGKNIIPELAIFSKKTIAPIKGSFPMLAPGSRVDYKEPLLFPGLLGKGIHSISKPGVYKIKAIYKNTANSSLMAGGVRLGSWTGTLTSNEITITVLPAEKQKFGKEVNGLAMGLSVDKNSLKLQGNSSGVSPFKMKIHFKNLQHKDLKLPSKNPGAGLYSLIYFEGKRIKGLGLNNLWKTEKDPVLEKNGILEVLPSSHLNFEKWISRVFTQPGVYTFSVKYSSGGMTPVRVPKNGIWGGDVISNTITITVLPAEKQKFGNEVNGLALGLSADRYETVMTGDASGVEPFKLQLHFKNSESITRKIKLGSLNRYMVLHIVGPKKGTVRKQFAKVNHFFANPTEMKIKGGNTYASNSVSFEDYFRHPDNKIGKINGINIKYSFLMPGTYKIKASYVQESDQTVWTGTVTSNEIEIVVKEAIDPAAVRRKKIQTLRSEIKNTKGLILQLEYLNNGFRPDKELQTKIQSQIDSLKEVCKQSGSKEAQENTDVFNMAWKLANKELKGPLKRTEKIIVDELRSKWITSRNNRRGTKSIKGVSKNQMDKIKHIEIDLFSLIEEYAGLRNPPELPKEKKNVISLQLKKAGDDLKLLYEELKKLEYQ